MLRQTQSKSLATSNQAGTSGAGHSKNIRLGRIDVAGLEHGERRRLTAHGTVLVLVISWCRPELLPRCTERAKKRRVRVTIHWRLCALGNNAGLAAQLIGRLTPSVSYVRHLQAEDSLTSTTVSRAAAAHIMELKVTYAEFKGTNKRGS